MNRRQFLLGGSIAIIAAATGALIANSRTSVGSASHEAVNSGLEK
jgi:hypothetical protein